MLHLIQSEIKCAKEQRNTFGNYNYRSCEDILESAKPVLLKHNFTVTLTDEIVLIGQRYYVKATAHLTGKDTNISVTGYAREAETKKGMDESQITGAASSYARKYALNGLFALDDNKDADSTNDHGKTTPAKAPTAPNQPTTPPKTETSKGEPFLVSGRIADIKKVTTKKADGTDLKRIDIILEDGKKYSTFSSIKSASGEKQNFETGDCVNIAYFQKGQYFNIITAEKFVNNADTEGLPF
jgi:hypothetical protein